MIYVNLLHLCWQTAKIIQKRGINTNIVWHLVREIVVKRSYIITITTPSPILFDIFTLLFYDWMFVCLNVFYLVKRKLELSGLIRRWKSIIIINSEHKGLIKSIPVIIRFYVTRRIVESKKIFQGLKVQKEFHLSCL